MLISIPLLAFLQAATTQPDPTPDAPPTPPPPACETQAHAGFDFWVGDWEVFPSGSDEMAANSRIERVFEGCAIREHWMPLKGFDGGSLSFIDHRSGQWEQVWVGGNGLRVDFSGGVVDGEMVLSGYWDDLLGPGKNALVRMTYSLREDGSVRQFGEASTDHGKTWQTSFDLIYRRKAASDSKDNP